MDFSKELAVRAEAARADHQNLEALKKIESEQKQLVIDIKAQIEQIFETVTRFYPNAIITPTHIINESGEIVSVLGAFRYCIVTFAADERYGFPTAVHFAFGVFPSEDYLVIKIVCDYMDSSKCQDHIKPLLRQLEKRHESGDCIYGGPYDPEGIKDAVEQAILNLLDRHSGSPGQGTQVSSE
jgi:hypothetical protein